jgi:DNA-binding beta-propeller fold protein YncE
MSYRVVTPTMIRRVTLGFAAILLLVPSLFWVATRAQGAPLQPSATPGSQSDGTLLLSNGWKVSPAGRMLGVGTLPLNLVTTADGRYAVITNNGLSKPTFTIVDLASWTVKNTVTVDNAWLGLAWSPDGTKLYSAGAGQNAVQEFQYGDGNLTRTRTLNLPARAGETFAGGVAVGRDGRTLYVTRTFAMTVSAVDLQSGQVTRTVTLDSEPYACVLSPDSRTLYVSLWGGAKVQAFAADTLAPGAIFETGEHPNAMVLSLDGRRLFVASANSGIVNVFDTFSGEALEEISTTLYPNAPRTSTPNALALSPDGRTLLVAVADMNAVAVVDVSNGGRSFVDGFIPAGWYPTGVAYSRDGKQILILSGKGMTPAANPLTGGMERRLAGVLSMLAVPDRVTLADLNRRVLNLTPYSDAIRFAPANVPIGSPIPRVVGGSSPIKHVFYIIRENRTYDQILGDLTEGNGDPKLALFGRDITPNAHALAQNFVVFDNFYVDADVSFDGHAYSTAAYATDVVQKIWQTVYANRGGMYLGEGGGFFRNAYGNLTAPERGYIWDFANRARVTVRSYGEFVDHKSKSASGDVVAFATVPGLEGQIAPTYAGFDLEITDNKRADTWLAEFREFEKNGNLPQFSVIHLPNDHTRGTVPGAPTPRAMVADNDLALGRMVEAISNSVYWKDSAIFVVEDDAQSGPDHVDAHRSVLLVASPFAKRNFVDHTFYTTSGVLRTIELVLGLEPMSHFDASATPLFNAFLGTPNLSAFQRQQPRVSLDERNLASAFGARESAAMNFRDEDRTPEALLNEIVWHSVMGPRVPMPPPRRSAFVRPAPSSGEPVEPENR